MFYGERNREGAQINFERAIELNPSYSTAYHWYALALSAMGKHDEAIENINKAMELEPRSAVIRSAAGLVYFYAKRYDEGITACRQSLEIDQGFVPAYKTMRVIYEASGNYNEALAAYRQERTFAGNTDEKEPGWLMITAQVEAVGGRRDDAFKDLKSASEASVVKNNPNAYAYEIAVAYALLGEKDAAIEWLKKAEAAQAHSFNFVQVDPRLDTLRGDERFNELLKAFN